MPYRPHIDTRRLCARHDTASTVLGNAMKLPPGTRTITITTGGTTTVTTQVPGAGTPLRMGSLVFEGTPRGVLVSDRAVVVRPAPGRHAGRSERDSAERVRIPWDVGLTGANKPTGRSVPGLKPRHFVLFFVDK